MDNKNNNSPRNPLDQFRLLIDYFTLAVTLASGLFLLAVPPENARFPPGLFVSLLLCFLLLHIISIRMGYIRLLVWSERLILGSGLLMWVVIWVNGELATILLPAFVSLAGLYALGHYTYLIIYSIGSVGLMFLLLKFQPHLDPAVVGRSAITLVSLILLLFFVRKYIELLNRSQSELRTLDGTLRGVLATAKINVFDLRVSSGEGKFIYSYDGQNNEFINASRWLELVDPQYRVLLQRNLQHLAVPTEFRVRLPGGDPLQPWRWLREQTIYEYRDESGELHRIGFSQNIDDEVAVREQLLLSLQIQASKQRHLKAEIEKFDSVCDQLDMVYWQLSLHDWSLIYNRQFALRWNLDPGGSIPYSEFKSLIHPDHMSFHDSSLQRVIETQTSFKTRCLTSAGPRAGRWFELSYWPGFDEDGNLAVINVSNIEVTDLMQAQEETRAKHEESLRQQRREKDMYAVIAHEMRTPAAILKMQLEQERKGLGQLDRKLFESSVDQLLGVVDTLRTVSQPDQLVSRDLSPTLPCELIANQVAILLTLAKDEGLELTADCSALTEQRTMLMQGPLKQLISNLVKNAIIHSGGTAVRLIARNDELDGSHLKITLVVEDDGRGIPENEIERLFEPYVRGEGAMSGTGLGLFVCRQIPTMMGGELHYENGQSGGARFVLTWTAELAAEDSVGSGAEIKLSLDEMKHLSVLLVEDDPGILQMTATLLTGECKRLRIAKNGKQALSILSETPIDLVLTDIFMPEMNGIDLVREMRQRSYLHPVIGLTAATLGQETANLLKVGANAVMNKPVDIDELKRLIGTLNLQSDKE